MAGVMCWHPAFVVITVGSLLQCHAETSAWQRRSVESIALPRRCVIPAKAGVQNPPQAQAIRCSVSAMIARTGVYLFFPLPLLARSSLPSA